MNKREITNKIGDLSPELAKALRSVQVYSETDPETSISKARKALEIIINDIEEHDQRSLADRISALEDTVPSSIQTYMHFIRRLGNSAVHSTETMSPQIAKDVEVILTKLVCWHLNIDIEETQKMKARFFIADGVYRTWPKLAVLTSDGALYSEYLTFMNPTQFKKAGFSFENFQASDFSFGQAEHGQGYQPLREVSKDEALEFQLTRQENWVRQYLSGLGI